jgi:hypothetical protein
MNDSPDVPEGLILVRLRTLAERVRRAIEGTAPSERAGMLSEFPRKCCHHGTNILALHLSELGLSDLTRATGERHTKTKTSWHVWIEHRGVIVDITADQFGKSFLPVIVTRRSRWHAAWNPKREPITKEQLTAWREADPDIYAVYGSYRTILANIRS